MAIYGICVICRKKVNDDTVKVEKIDGLWLCGAKCVDKFLKEKKKWTPGGWVELCQLLYEEHEWAGGKANWFAGSTGYHTHGSNYEV